MTRPVCVQQDDGLIVALDDSSRVVAQLVPGNPLAADWTLPETSAARLVTWSGTMADDLFERSPMTWLAPGHEALRAWLERVAPEIERRGQRLCLHPHCRHVLSDPQSCLVLIGECPSAAVEIMLAPASMLESTMLDQVEDHFVRAFETLGPHCALVRLDDLAAPEADGELPRRVDLGRGGLPADLVRRLLAEHVPPEVPVVIGTGSVATRGEWIGD